MKVRTHYLADEPGLWTSDDMEAARCHANEYHCPARIGYRTAREVWDVRTPIDEAEREMFSLTLNRQESLMQEEIKLHPEAENNSAWKAALQRDAISQALVESGNLTITWRSIALPIKPRKCARIM